MANYIAKEHNGSDGANSRTKSTFSVWVKRCRTGVAEQIWSWGENNSSDARLKFQSDDVLRLHSDGAGSPIETTQKFRDCNGWYHFVAVFDGSNGTEAYRRRVWINGVEWIHGASTSTFSAAVAGHNSVQDLYIGDNARMQQNSSNAEPFVGYMSHFHYCDGYAYTAADFGETDATTGEWKAITEPSVTYGTHGIFLKMEDSSNMDLDSSPNASSQLSTTGTILPSEDCPNNVFCTLNPLNGVQPTGGITSVIKYGNNEFRDGENGSNFSYVAGTIGARAGKFYWETKVTDLAEIDQVGVALASVAFSNLATSHGLQATNYGGKGCQFSNGNKVGDGSGSAYMGGFSVNDIMMIALDLDNNKITFGRNGQWADGSGNANQTYANSTAAYTNLTAGEFYVPAQAKRASGSNYGTNSYNFGNGCFGTTAISSEGTNASGNGRFEYDVPTGFTALSTQGLNK
jgi:hypothetical protein